MCEPAAIIAGAALAVSVYSSISAANSQAEAGRKEQDYYNFLADNNDRQAVDTLAKADQSVGLTQDQAGRDTQVLRNEVHKIEGTQKSTLAANGVGLDSATAEDIATDTLDREKMDELAIRYNADMKSWDMLETAKQNAYQLRLQARGYRMGGANARSAGDANSTTTLLGGAGTVAGRGYDLSQTSAFRSKNSEAVTPTKFYSDYTPSKTRW